MASAAHQMTGGSGGAAGGVRCYYDLLEVGRQATDDELKKAYRRLALRWHPDKNPDRIDEATAQFRLVQKAYEILSDPQERAWYDKHRERILRGGLGRGDSYKEERLDVFQYFTSACYDDYDDGAQGYFTVYAGVFAGLAEEEVRAGVDGDEATPANFPEFGRSDSDYDTIVGPFYAHWETFFTRKSYVWVEQHDTREAPNKFVRKAMEKENKAAREAARRERNEEVRTLVAFVKKRDPRVRAERRRLEARAREVEAKAKAKAAEARRAHLETAGRYQAPEWARLGDLEAELARLETAHGAIESGDDSDDSNDSESHEGNAAEDEQEQDPLSGLIVCLACEKVFRTQGAKVSHDRSKRHRDRVERLRAELAGHDAAEEAVKEGEQPTEAPQDTEEGSEEADEAAENGEGEAQKARKRSKKKKRQQLLLLQNQKVEDVASDQDQEETAAAPADKEASDGDEGGAPAAPAADEPGKKPRRRKDRQRQKQLEQLEQRRAELAEAAADGGGGAQVCKTCRQWFDSKNQLFKHLKDTGHAAVKPGGGGGGSAASTGASARTEGKKVVGKRSK